MKVHILLVTFLILIINSNDSLAQDIELSQKMSKGDFPLFYQNKSTDIVVDEQDDEVVVTASNLLAEDIRLVTGYQPKVVRNTASLPQHVVIIGSLNKSRVIQQLIKDKKIKVESIQGRWESTIITVVENPFPKVKSALVIVGSDRRGAAYGAIELSRKIGVSPWVWWADVPVQKKKTIIIKKGEYLYGPPAVKYRGIFLNDELWGLRQWAALTQDIEYKDLGPNAYKRIFELMLRLKSNYFWPAKATPFNEKPENAALADQYGIVRGGAHNAPMLGNTRKEWDENRDGPWNYETNAEKIREFWRERINRFGKYENLYTIGMRGSGDLPMGGGENIDEKVDLLGKVISDQRGILAKELNKDISKIPQAFVAYKEVLDLYDHGLKLPEDVIMVWPDDNYGYILRLPSPKEQKRPGGNGVYFHVSYLGRPHDYLWLSTMAPMHIWEELHKAYQFNARDLWVINIGDIKPAEYEFQLTMDLAWQADNFNPERLHRHQEEWLINNFGEKIGKDAQKIKQKYYHLAFIRRPEFMGWSRIEPNTPVIDTEFSFINYQEAEKRLKEYQELQNQAEDLFTQVPESHKAAFYQLVYYPVVGASLMNKKLLIAQKNRWYARQGRSMTNQLAAQAVQYHDSIFMLTKQYEALNNNKWQDMASYDDLPFNVYKSPPVDSIQLNNNPDGDVWAQANEGDEIVQVLPVFNQDKIDTSFFEVYNKSLTPANWQAEANQPWIILSAKSGNEEQQERVYVTVDWEKIPPGNDHEGKITVKVGDTMREIKVVAKANSESKQLKNIFIEKNEVLSIPATAFHEKEDKGGYEWTSIDGIGISGKMMTTIPVTSNPIDHEWEVAENAPNLSYDFYTTERGWFNIFSFTLPTHSINEYRSCMYGISIDDQPPLIIDFSTRNRSEQWKENVSRNSARIKSHHYIEKPGKHTLKVWLIDTGVYFDKFILDFGGLKDSYLGPEE